uniref:Uncharacterized protein n=1 Tax=Oryza nivara TaxID=4536 RepID=A0A0E0G863_ORYNI
MQSVGDPAPPQHLVLVVMTSSVEARTLADAVEEENDGDPHSCWHMLSQCCCCSSSSLPPLPPPAPQEKTTTTDADADADACGTSRRSTR